MFETNNGTLLEIALLRASTPKGCLVVWPCYFGNVHDYGIPAKAFLDMGYSVALYNPRGHGNSSCQMAMRSAIADLIEFLNRRGLYEMPLIAVGHSAGANGLLEVSRAIDNIVRFFLVAPGFDPRDAIFHMYRMGTIDKFIRILTSYTGDVHLIKRVLADKAWMDYGYFKSEQIRQRLDGLPGPVRIGQFLEDQFFTGVNSYDILGHQRNKTQIFLPHSDDWQPMEITLRLSEEYGIPTIPVASAKEHLFIDAWPDVWAHIGKNLSFS